MTSLTSSTWASLEKNASSRTNKRIFSVYFLRKRVVPFIQTLIISLVYKALGVVITAHDLSLRFSGRHGEWAREARGSLENDAARNA